MFAIGTFTNRIEKNLCRYISYTSENVKGRNSSKYYLKIRFISRKEQNISACGLQRSVGLWKSLRQFEYHRLWDTAGVHQCCSVVGATSCRLVEGYQRSVGTRCPYLQSTSGNRLHKNIGYAISKLHGVVFQYIPTCLFRKPKQKYLNPFCVKLPVFLSLTTR